MSNLSIEQFLERMDRRARFTEWKVLLALAYDGPETMWKIKEKHDIKYSTVQQAIKRLENMGWIAVICSKASKKNTPTKVYRLTSEGLIWTLAKSARKLGYLPPLADYTDSQASGPTPTRFVKKDLSKLAELKTTKEVYSHLIFFLDVDKIAKNNADYYPLLFGRWTTMKKTLASGHLAREFPAAALQSLREYYNNPSGIKAKFGSLEMLFTYRAYYRLVESLFGVRGYTLVTGDHDDFTGNMIVKNIAETFKGDKKLEKLCLQICTDIKEKLENGVLLVDKVKQRLRK